MPTPYATTADVQTRYPNEAAMLCADETTRTPDWARFDAALSDVSMEIRIILKGRYTVAELDGLDAESLGALKAFAIDMAMYRVAVAYSRSTERLKEIYDNAVARLEGIASGKKGGLTFASNTSGGVAGGETVTTSPGQAIVEAPERQFSRDRMW